MKSCSSHLLLPLLHLFQEAVVGAVLLGAHALGLIAEADGVVPFHPLDGLLLVLLQVLQLRVIVLLLRLQEHNKCFYVCVFASMCVCVCLWVIA